MYKSILQDLGIWLFAIAGYGLSALAFLLAAAAAWTLFKVRRAVTSDDVSNVVVLMLGSAFVAAVTSIMIGALSR